MAEECFHEVGFLLSEMVDHTSNLIFAERNKCKPFTINISTIKRGRILCPCEGANTFEAYGSSNLTITEFVEVR